MPKGQIKTGMRCPHHSVGGAVDAKPADAKIGRSSNRARTRRTWINSSNVEEPVLFAADHVARATALAWRPARTTSSSTSRSTPSAADSHGYRKASRRRNGLRQRERQMAHFCYYVHCWHGNSWQWTSGCRFGQFGRPTADRAGGAPTRRLSSLKSCWSVVNSQWSVVCGELAIFG